MGSIRCKLKECRKKCGIYGMKCQYCKKIFCTPHLSIEMHKCENSQQCKDEKRKAMLVSGF